MASVVDRDNAPYSLNGPPSPTASFSTAFEQETPRTSANGKSLHLDLDQARQSDSSDEAPPDTASSTLTSSSISSPPYWLNSSSSRSHRRTISTMSAESVLPTGAITLRDNDTNEHNDRSSACWAKSVEIADYTVVNGASTNVGAFVVWNIRVETLTGSFMNIRKRYSEFDDFRRQLVQSFPNSEAAVPALPPKSVISRFRPRFLEKRRAGLQYFLNCILLNPEFSGSPVLKDFLFA
ncbi:PX domain-containing protein [Paramyrothecium foliicola]|nr:PX domain-containing protein [Paramyrothecium foliicola]